MPETIKITAPAAYVAESYKVFLREHWGDAWEEVPFYCNWVSWSAAPTISAAEFERRYGDGMDRDRREEHRRATSRGERQRERQPW